LLLGVAVFLLCHDIVIVFHWKESRSVVVTAVTLKMSYGIFIQDGSHALDEGQDLSDLRVAAFWEAMLSRLNGKKQFISVIVVFIIVHTKLYPVSVYHLLKCGDGPYHLRKAYILSSLHADGGGPPVKEIRFHGRGGQGAVTAAELIAIAAFEDKKYSQAFPAFGVERRGAPVMAFARISDEPIRIRSQIYEPDYVVVQDVTLLDVVDVASGLKPEGKIIVNADRKAGDLNLETEAEIIPIDATKIALEELGRPIVNTTMLGAFCGATGEVGLESLNTAILSRFKGALGEKNLNAIKAAYERVSQ
jgi:pyruvate ferredoxin oxidoreductase gamma subunit